MRRLKADISHRVRPKTFTTGWLELLLGCGIAVLVGLTVGPSVATWLGSDLVRGLTPWARKDERGGVSPAPTGVVGLAAPARTSAVTSADGSVPSSRPSASLSAPAPPAPVAAVAATTRPVAAVFRIQVGAFVERQNADALVGRLRGAGFAATASVSEQGGFRVVRVGVYGSKEDADQALAALVARGFTGFVVRER